MSSPRRSSDRDFDYHSLDVDNLDRKRTDPQPREEKKPRLTSTPSALIINGVLPFLRSSDRARLSTTGRALQHIDPVLQHIHLLQQWEILIENEAKKVDWKKLIISPKALFSSICTLALAGSSTAFYFLVKLSVESPNDCDDGQDARCSGRAAGAFCAALVGVGLLCCTYPMVKHSRAIRSAHHNPRAYGVSKDTNAITRTSTEIKDCVDEFNNLYPDLPINPVQTTLFEFKVQIEKEKRNALFFMNNFVPAHLRPHYLQRGEHTIDMQGDEHTSAPLSP